MIKNIKIKARPHNWPRSGTTGINEWALVVVDMQNDYCTRGCYMDKAGFNLEPLRKPIENISSVIKMARENGLEVIFTRHGEVNTEQLPSTASSKNTFCWEITEELKPTPAERVFDKSTTSAFVSSSIDQYLKQRGIKYLAFCGNTIDCCVHSTLRSANDLGYKCLLLEDCCGAINESLHKWSIESIIVENGVFGAVTNSSDFIKSITS
ncbi:MAG: isochorismatase family cysteine hydrolase [Candidatus Shapirobacteria bacterium]|jgi:nicotinamidase-related amidase